MARPKSNIRKALSDAHLKAIGTVAANWSELEFCIMWLVAKESGTTLQKTIAMIGGNGISSWLKILQRLFYESGSQWKWKNFVDLKLQVEIDELQGHRNAIVHAAWSEPQAPSRLAELLYPQKGRKPPLVASGIGFKKGTPSITTGFEYTAAQIRSVAKRIEAMPQALIDWSVTPSPEQKRLQLAQALKDYKPRSRAKPKTSKK